MLIFHDVSSSCRCYCCCYIFAVVTMITDLCERLSFTALPVGWSGRRRLAVTTGQKATHSQHNDHFGDLPTGKYLHK